MDDPICEPGTAIVKDGSRTPLEELVKSAAAGDRQAAYELLPVVYRELRQLAARNLAKLAPGQTLQPTALVHEAYVRLVGDRDPGWQSRRHFFGAAANAMRHVLIDLARKKASVKRGADRGRVNLSEIGIAIEMPTERVLMIDEALTRMEESDPDLAEIVRLRYFSGLSLDDVSEVTGIPLRTLGRKWRFARAQMRSYLDQQD